ncbi:MAG: alcohol dehydrogenase catalytic domain-containing protein [Chloroflexi bacterium]|nr:alcohol dehydrogenase catalytic domain-containing protein [Chloroflexota bacterium]
MQAVYLADGRLIYQNNYPEPEVKAGEARIRVRLAGICATDLEMVKGYNPDFRGILGHEFVGIVDAVADADDVHWLGQRVVGSINLGCGQCAVCQNSGPEHCANRAALGIHGKDGVFADYVTLPVANLHPVPENAADETAVFTEPLAAALRIREQVAIQPTMKTAVVGPGRLGLLVGMVLALDGTDIVMLGRRSASLELPLRLGLNTGLVNDFADDSFDMIVEATGNDAGFAQSLRLVRPLGTLVLKSTFSGAVSFNLSKLIVSEVNVVGSRCGPFKPALRLLAQEQIDPRPLVAAEYALRDGLAAFQHAAQPGVRKILLRP